MKRRSFFKKSFWAVAASLLGAPIAGEVVRKPIESNNRSGIYIDKDGLLTTSYKTVKKICENAGIGDVKQFYV